MLKKLSRKQLTERQPTRPEVATVAIYVLGGASRSIDTEDAAVRCHELAPSMFSWQKHKEQINLELVRVSLSDAKKPKNGALVSGSGREGWRLSPQGLDWIGGVGAPMLALAKQRLGLSVSSAGSIDSVRRQRERSRLIASDGWQEWSVSRRVSTRPARDIFRIDEYTTEKMLEIKVARIRAMFEQDTEIREFLEQASLAIRPE